MCLRVREAHHISSEDHHQPIAVVLDFVNLQRPGRWPRYLRRLARFDEAGGMATLDRHHDLFHSLQRPKSSSLARDWTLWMS